MNGTLLLKRLLPGLLPLLVFIVADELYGTEAGLAVAVSFGLLQLAYMYILHRTVDRFTLYDTLLIIALGGASLLLENDLFFKLKPVLVGVILCALLGISAFSRTNLVTMMTKRYMGDAAFSAEQTERMRSGLRTMFVLFSLHTALVLYAALFLSTEAWAFISTAVFYMMFGLYLAVELAANWFRRRRLRNEEWLPLVDEEGKVTGQAPRSVVHGNNEMLHPVVHLHVLNGRNEVFLQKRSLTKAAQPGKWDSAVGGHVAVNETVEAALRRETREELGVDLPGAVPVGRFIVRNDRESEMVFLFVARHEGPFTLDPSEASEGRFWTAAELEPAIRQGLMTPTVPTELSILTRTNRR